MSEEVQEAMDTGIEVKVEPYDGTYECLCRCGRARAPEQFKPRLRCGERAQAGNLGDVSTICK